MPSCSHSLPALVTRTAPSAKRKPLHKEADLMADDTRFANALLAVLQRQRNLAQDLCAQAEATVAVLEADNARLAAENAKLREEMKVDIAPQAEEGR